MTEPCPFCEIVAGRAPATILANDGAAMVIRPLNPVTPDHVLVIPQQHVPDVLVSPGANRACMTLVTAAARERGACNVITSAGAAATQTVRHLHWHIVPRRPGDGLLLPWTNQPGQEEGEAPFPVGGDTSRHTEPLWRGTTAFLGSRDDPRPGQSWFVGGFVLDVPADTEVEVWPAGHRPAGVTEEQVWSAICEAAPWTESQGMDAAAKAVMGLLADANHKSITASQEAGE